MLRLRLNPKDLKAEALKTEVDQEQIAVDAKITKAVHAVHEEVRNAAELEVKVTNIAVEITKVNREGNKAAIMITAQIIGVVHAAAIEVKNAAEPKAAVQMAAVKNLKENQATMM